MARIKVGIVGGTGYTGVELLRLLSQHPEAELVAITSRKEDGMPVADMFSNLRGKVDLAFSSPEKARLAECDVVFFATPHGVAMAQAQELLDAGVRIIDLAADFRLQNLGAFEKWYKMPHACPGVLKESVYGLVEVNREKIRNARVVGNPGCYPTTVLLGLAPLLEGQAGSAAPLVDASTLIADCKSGVTGAGRKAEVGLLFSEASDNFKAYGVMGHRHHPEIVEHLEALHGGPVGLTFVPHLTPMVRGMHSTIYARIAKQSRGVDFQKLYEDRYAGEPFVDVMPPGSTPETRSVRASNMLRIAVHRPEQDGKPGDQLVILVVQDNLVKGASGQAVQNMNLMFGLPENAGLEQVAVLPLMRKQGLLASFALAVMMAGAAVGLSLRPKPAVPQAGMAEAADLKAENQRLEAEGARLQDALDAAESRLAIGQAERNQMAADLLAARKENGDLRNDLAFFEQLIPADPRVTQLSIRSAELTREGTALRYRVLLMRGGRPGGEFRGRLQFTAEGTRDGAAATVELQPFLVPVDDGAVPAPGKAAELLLVKFRQYLRAEGALELPSGFTATRVTVRVVENGLVRAESLARMDAPRE